MLMSAFVALEMAPVAAVSDPPMLESERPVVPLLALFKDARLIASVALDAVIPAPAVAETEPVVALSCVPAAPVNAPVPLRRMPTGPSATTLRLERLRCPVTLLSERPDPPTPLPAEPIESVPPLM